MKVFIKHLQRFLPELKWSADKLATNLSMIGHEAEITGDALEVKVFPNRGDVLSLRGLSRDLAALYPTVGEWRDVAIAPLPEPSDFYPLTIAESAKDVVWSDHLLKIENYQAMASPTEITDVLKSLNLQPKDLLIDITNIVAYEIGQPLHAFDYDKVSEGMTIERARNNEELTLLNKKTYSLSSDALIARTSDGAPTDLLGVMGGDNSAVTSATSNVLLQAASLSGKSVRTNCRISGLKTEASYRYERGVDPELAARALGRVVFYLQQYAPSVKVSSYQQLLNLPSNKKVSIRAEQIARLLGTEISQKNVLDLERLGFRVNADEVGVPSWRFDIENWADVTEEVARLIGLNNIKPAALTKEKAVTTGQHAQVLGLKHLLAKNGYTETMTYSFASDGPVTLQNPRTDDQRALRSSLKSGLITTLARNPFLPKAAFFEIGNVFLPDEAMFLGVVVSGVKSKQLEATQVALTHLLGTTVRLEAVDQPTLDQFDAKQRNVYWWELPLSEVKLPTDYSYKDQTLASYQPISKYPPVVRDVTLLVQRSVSPEEIILVARESDSVLIVELVDRYEAETLGQDKVALTFRLFFQKTTDSLTDEAAKILLDRVFQRLRDKVEFEIR